MESNLKESLKLYLEDLAAEIMTAEEGSETQRNISQSWFLGGKAEALNEVYRKLSDLVNKE